MDENNQANHEDQKPVEYGPLAVVSGDTSKPMYEKPAGRSKFGFLKSKKFLIAAAVLVLGAGAGLTFALTGSDKKDEVTEDQSRQMSMGVAPSLVDGAATYKVGDGEWQPLTAGTSLSAGTWVSVENGGRVVLSFDDGSAIRLDQSSIVKLASLDPEDIRIEQTAGTAYSRVVTSDRQYTVSVDGTDYQALGTAFSTTATATKKGVQVLQSKVKTSGTDTEVDEGKQYFKEHENAELKDKLTDINIDELKSNGFMLWNLEQDEQDEKFKDKLGVWQKVKEQTAVQQEEEQTSTGGIELSASNNDKGTVLSWKVSGVDVGKGFKIVRSKSTSTPLFGKDEAVYVDKSSARSYTWKSDKEGEFWYRVCAYRPDQGTCVNYSNAVKMTAVYKPAAKVTRGTMTLAVGEDDRSLSWSYSGQAIYGYKVVVSSSPNPVYPDSGYAFYGANTTHTLKDSDLKPGQNYVRVCAYTDGTESEKCVDYSNQIIIIKSE